MRRGQETPTFLMSTPRRHTSMPETWKPHVVLLITRRHRLASPSPEAYLRHIMSRVLQMRKAGVWQIAYGRMKSSESGWPVLLRRSDDFCLGGMIALSCE